MDLNDRHYDIKCCGEQMVQTNTQETEPIDLECSKCHEAICLYESELELAEQVEWRKKQDVGSTDINDFLNALPQ